MVRRMVLQAQEEGVRVRRETRNQKIRFHLSGCFDIEKGAIIATLLSDPKFKHLKTITKDCKVVVGKPSPLATRGRPEPTASVGTEVTLGWLFGMWKQNVPG